MYRQKMQMPFYLPLPLIPPARGGKLYLLPLDGGGRVGVKYAQEATGVDTIYAVMGGFHLTGAVNEPAIGPTIEALKELNPGYIVPTHCTGRKAAMLIEKEMPEKFLLKMSGTKMIFATQ